MNNAAAVDAKIEAWKKRGMTKQEIAARTAEACLGWPYVYGARGQLCTPAYRESRAKSSGDEGPVIIKNCQVLSRKKSSCDGCKWYPGSQRVRCYDCRGFTFWVLKQVDVVIDGAGATSQWNTAANWVQKGPIDQLPKDKIACVFWRDKKKPGVMAHTGLYIGNGTIIHCSGTVKKGAPTDRGWTDYAIPAGMEGDIPVTRPTLKKGSKGAYVSELQQDLIKLGYDVGKTGADGKYGKNTQTAVKSFQQKNGVNPADGVCGPDTWDAILQALDPGTLYTVTIKHLSKAQADTICKTYANAEMVEEKE